MTQIRQRCNVLFAESIDQFPKQDTIKAFGRIIQISPYLMGGMVAVKRIGQSRKHVAGNQPLDPSDEKLNVFIAGGAEIEYLSVGPTFDDFCE